jgi:hypothetical protein
MAGGVGGSRDTGWKKADEEDEQQLDQLGVLHLDPMAENVA